MSVGEPSEVDKFKDEMKEIKKMIMEQDELINTLTSKQKLQIFTQRSWKRASILYL